MTERQLGTFTVHTRLYLTTEQRVKLEHLVRERRMDLSDLVSEIIGEYLDSQPIEALPPPDSPSSRAADLRTRRAELAQLRARRDAAGSAAPAWLRTYIADLEQEIRRLEG
jgi:hypothetical protein